MVAVLNVEVVEEEETKNSLGLRLQKHVKLSLNIFGKYYIYGETALSATDGVHLYIIILS